MQYILTRFTHEMGFRVFEFEGIDEDRVRTEYKVRADLALTHKYGIRVQELPLLCRGILERREAHEARQTFTYTEADMRLNAEVSASRAADAEKRRAPRKPTSANVGVAWRGPHV